MKVDFMVKRLTHSREITLSDFPKYKLYQKSCQMKLDTLVYACDIDLNCYAKISRQLSQGWPV